METFEKTTLIDCSAKELFDFHLDTNNIKLITPKHTKVELLDYEDSTYEGKIVKAKNYESFYLYELDSKNRKTKISKFTC